MPNADQLRAIQAVDRWLASGTARSFVLGGLAGTGKTSLLPMLPLPTDTRYAAPTWKAAQVLERKLGEPVTSIHSLIYNPAGILHEVECRYAKTGRCTLKCTRMAWSYDPKERPSLLVVDEASMVGESVRQDLDQLGVPIMYVGDVGQLPPVRDGRSIFEERRCDAMLQAVQRQAADSPILDLSRVVRNGDAGWLDHARRLGIPVFRSGSGSRNRYSLATFDHGSPETVFIAGTNRAVDGLNRKTRKHLGMGPEPLVPGDRVMLQNSLRGRDLYNGQQGVIKAVDVNAHAVHVEMETGVHYFGPVLVQGIDDIPQDPEVPDVRHSYAVTCHKAQGSEFRNVVVYLERSRVETRQWLYTAITRASHNLTFVTTY